MNSSMLTIVLLFNCVAIVTFVAVNIVTTRILLGRNSSTAASMEKMAVSIQTLSDKLDTHRSINADYGAALEMGTETLERIAERTKLPEDIKQAEKAQRLSTEHGRKLQEGQTALNKKV